MILRSAPHIFFIASSLFASAANSSGPGDGPLWGSKEWYLMIEAERHRPPRQAFTPPARHAPPPRAPFASPPPRPNPGGYEYRPQRPVYEISQPPPPIEVYPLREPEYTRVGDVFHTQPQANLAEITRVGDVFHTLPPAGETALTRVGDVFHVQLEAGPVELTRVGDVFHVQQQAGPAELTRVGDVFHVQPDAEVAHITRLGDVALLPPAEKASEVTRLGDVYTLNQPPAPAPEVPIVEVPVEPEPVQPFRPVERKHFTAAPPPPPKHVPVPVYRQPPSQRYVFRPPPQRPAVQRPPQYSAPIFPAPIYRAPIYKRPIYPAPVYQRPVYPAPIYQMPRFETVRYAVPRFERPCNFDTVYQAALPREYAFRSPCDTSQSLGGAVTISAPPVRLQAAPVHITIHEEWSLRGQSSQWERAFHDEAGLIQLPMQGCADQCVPRQAIQSQCLVTLPHPSGALASDCSYQGGLIFGGSR